MIYACFRPAAVIVNIRQDGRAAAPVRLPGSSVDSDGPELSWDLAQHDGHQLVGLTCRVGRRDRSGGVWSAPFRAQTGDACMYGAVDWRT